MGSILLILPFQPLSLRYYMVHPNNNVWKTTRFTFPCKSHKFPGSERWLVQISQHRINICVSPNRYEKIGLRGLLLIPLGIIWTSWKELLISGLGNGQRVLVSLVLDVASLLVFPLHLLQEQTLVQICTCLKGIWLSCFHVSFFSCFLTCSISFFSLLLTGRLSHLKVSLGQSSSTVAHCLPLHMEVPKSLLCVIFLQVLLFCLKN